MNQEKMGKFLLESRKQKGFTQKELAEKVGVSDKTISKWECGNSIPDISYLDSLCNSLDITMNELLSGERLTKDSYSEKAEENIMELMKENEAHKKSGFWRIVLGIALGGIGCLLFSLGYGNHLWALGSCWDGVSMITLALLCAAVLVSRYVCCQFCMQ